METTNTAISEIDRKFLLEHGFTEDESNKTLSELFTNNQKFKEIHVDVSNIRIEPYMMLLRSIEKNVTVKVDTVQEKRLILKKGDRYKTVIMNIVFNEISNCLFKDYEDGWQEFVFEIRGLQYSLNVLI